MFASAVGEKLGLLVVRSGVVAAVEIFAIAWVAVELLVAASVTMIGLHVYLGSRQLSYSTRSSQIARGQRGGGITI